MDQDPDLINSSWYFAALVYIANQYIRIHVQYRTYRCRRGERGVLELGEKYHLPSTSNQILPNGSVSHNLLKQI
jgi:hypothetical protein